MTPRLLRAATAIAAVALAAAAPGCRTPGTSPQSTQGKSKTMDSLAAKLVIASARISTSESLQVSVEITNRGSTAVQVPSGDPFSFQAEVRDSRGLAVPPSLQRVDVLSAPRWVRVEPGASTAVTVTIAPEAGYQLDTTTHVWRLPAGSYELAGRFAVEAGDAADAPADAWTGAIDLAPVPFEIVP